MRHQLRPVRRSELPAVYDLLEGAFPEAARATFVAQTKQDSTFRLRHGRVAVAPDGRIDAYVRIFARRMLLDGAAVQVGGIGSVATDPRARGAGLATALLRDAIRVMRGEGMALSFLFTGIAAFYERLGWKIVHQPSMVAEAHEAAALEAGRAYRIRRIRDADTSALLAVYRRATDGATGAIVRTPHTWRDALTWLDEDAAGCLLAEYGGRAVAYVRSRSRGNGYQLLELEHRPEHAAAAVALLARVGRRAASLEQRIVALPPHESTLAAVLRSLPGTNENRHFRFPMMVKTLTAGTRVPSSMRFWNTDRI